MSSGGSEGVIEPGPEVVCDAGPLIHLDELDCLGLLSDFSAIWVPDAVRREVAAHRPGALNHNEVRLRFPARDPDADAALAAVVKMLALERGEETALALTRTRLGALLLTDDSAARLAARGLGIRVHGSIGVVLRALRRGLRTRREVLDLLRSLPSKSTLHIRPRLLDEIIREVEELQDD